MTPIKNHIITALSSLKRRRALAAVRHADMDSSELEVELAGIPLNATRSKKLATLARILGTSETRAAVELYKRMFAGLPDRPLPAFLLPDLRVKTCERIGDELLRIELKEGRVFFGQRSNEKEYLLHHAFKDYLPEIVNGDAYKLALDVQRRYFGAGLNWYAIGGGVFVEGGCFTGMKAIGWHDGARKPARIIAVEIGGRNAEILTANIRANGLESAITPVHAGLWHESGEGVQKHAFSTRRFLASTDQWQGHMLHEEKVRLLTVGDLLDEAQVETADYFNVQVNGAEIDVMKGALDALDRVKVFDIAAYYSKDGTRNVDVIREMLTAKGCTVVNESERGRIALATPKFRDEIMALKPRDKARRTKAP